MRITSLLLTLAIIGLIGIGVQAQQEDIQVSISTKMHDSWEFSGNIHVGNTTFKSVMDQPDVIFHSFGENENLDDILAEELDNMSAPAVALTDFSASYKFGGVEIDWTFVQNPDVEKFFVQRSGDALHWEDIGMLQVLADGQVLQDYRYTDNSPMRGSNYYRLRQVREDENSDLSDVIAVEVLEKGYHVTHMFPSPVVFGASIDFELFEPATVNIRLLDTNERRLGTIYSDFTSIGRHTVELNLDSLPRGLYTCEIQVGASKTRRTFVK